MLTQMTEKDWEITVEVFRAVRSKRGEYKTHRRIKTWMVTAHPGRGRNLAPPSGQGPNVWADTAYPTQKNEKHLRKVKLKSAIHRKKPRGKPMSERTANANAAKSKLLASVEHVSAWQKGPMGLFVRTTGLARATVKIRLINLVTNLRRMVWLTQNPTAV